MTNNLPAPGNGFIKRALIKSGEILLPATTAKFTGNKSSNAVTNPHMDQVVSVDDENVHWTPQMLAEYVHATGELPPHMQPNYHKKQQAGDKEIHIHIHGAAPAAAVPAVAEPERSMLTNVASVGGQLALGGAVLGGKGLLWILRQMFKRSDREADRLERIALAQIEANKQRDAAMASANKFGMIGVIAALAFIFAIVMFAHPHGYWTQFGWVPYYGYPPSAIVIEDPPRVIHRGSDYEQVGR